MAKTKTQKSYYYVLVFTNGGPVYLTSLGDHKVAYWNPKEKPKLLTKEMATSIAVGLGVNGTNAIPVMAPYELDYHPYNYDDYEFSFKERSNENEN